MIDKLGSVFDKLKPQYDDGAVDRMNYIWTNFILVAFAITIGAKQYVGEPLQCWVPAQFTGGWEKYVENYCFVENTYWVPLTSRLPSSHDEREERELQYYQWVPFVLALQAMMFYVPRLVWNMLSSSSGMNVTGLIQSAFITKKSGEMKSLKSHSDVTDGVKVIKTHITDVNQFQRNYGHRKNGRSNIPVVSALSQGMGIYLTSLYIFCKILWIVNVVGQFLILNKFLGSNYSWWGIEILGDLIRGTEWETSGHFPRVTFCDFVVRRLGNLHRFSVQCVLMINMFNEKIFLFLWWWFFILAIVTVLDTLYWLVISVVPGLRRSFVSKYLRVKKRLSDFDSEEKLRRFMNETLRPDGVLVLRLIAANAGQIVCADIVDAMWTTQFGDLDPTAPRASIEEDEEDSKKK